MIDKQEVCRINNKCSLMNMWNLETKVVVTLINVIDYLIYLKVK